MKRISCICFLVACCVSGFASDTQAPEEEGTLILAHYMPWYQAKPFSSDWGWHWTMNAFDPESEEEGARKVASHYTPMIGAYDSADPEVIEYQLLTMRLAGIDGVIIDWYGREDVYDYAQIHRNSLLLVERIQALGMSFAICYEDQTLGPLVEAGRIDADGRVAHVKSEIEWLAEHWFSLPNYAQLEGKPLLMSFGYSGLSDLEWKKCIESLDTEVAYLSEHRRRNVALGAFDWPMPSKGVAQTERFLQDAKSWKQAVPVAFPRFVDIYEEAGVHASWGRIEDGEGETFALTLERALSSGASIVQLVTWNDWGEGTMLEPSEEFGYRDLALLQAMRRKWVEPDFSYAAADLELPYRLYEMRREGVDTADAIAVALATGDLELARKLMDQPRVASR